MTPIRAASIHTWRRKQGCVRGAAIIPEMQLESTVVGHLRLYSTRASLTRWPLCPTNFDQSFCLMSVTDFLLNSSNRPHPINRHDKLLRTQRHPLAVSPRVSVLVDIYLPRGLVLRDPTVALDIIDRRAKHRGPKLHMAIEMRIYTMTFLKTTVQHYSPDPSFASHLPTLADSAW